MAAATLQVRVLCLEALMRTLQRANEDEQLAIIRAEDSPVAPADAQCLADVIARTRASLPLIRLEFAEGVAAYVRTRMRHHDRVKVVENGVDLARYRTPPSYARTGTFRICAIVSPKDFLRTASGTPQASNMSS